MEQYRLTVEEKFRYTKIANLSVKNGNFTFCRRI